MDISFATEGDSPGLLAREPFGSRHFRTALVAGLNLDCRPMRYEMDIVADLDSFQQLLRDKQELGLRCVSIDKRLRGRPCVTTRCDCEAAFDAAVGVGVSVCRAGSSCCNSRCHLKSDHAGI